MFCVGYYFLFVVVVLFFDSGTKVLKTVPLDGIKLRTFFTFIILILKIDIYNQWQDGRYKLRHRKFGRPNLQTLTQPDVIVLLLPTKSNIF